MWQFFVLEGFFLKELKEHQMAENLTRIKNGEAANEREGSPVCLVVPVRSLQEIEPSELQKIVDTVRPKQVIFSVGISHQESGNERKFAHDDYLQDRRPVDQANEHMGEKFSEIAGTEKTIVYAPIGKASQINWAVKNCRQEFVWVVHADTWLKSADPSWFQTPDADTVYYGRLSFHGKVGALMFLNALGVELRCRTWGMPFGDQGFLFSKALWQKLGGFDKRVTLGESHDFAWRAKRQGFPVKKGPYHLSTSDEKYAKRGWLAMTARHLWASIVQKRKFKARRICNLNSIT